MHGEMKKKLVTIYLNSVSPLSLIQLIQVRECSLMQQLNAPRMWNLFSVRQAGKLQATENLCLTAILTTHDLRLKCRQKSETQEEFCRDIQKYSNVSVRWCRHDSLVLSTNSTVHNDPYVGI